MEQLIEFLKGREIDWKRFEEEKIDSNVVAMMTDDQLKEFIPAYGDRVAVFTFCRTCAQGGDRQTVSAFGQSLAELRKKWQSKKGFKSGNMCAKKESRRVELGWMDYDTNGFKQVRQKSGGGVRHLSVNKTLPFDGLMTHARETFFPNGESQKGNMEDFDISLKDFKGADINPNSTVTDLYCESKLRILRVYLYTKRKDSVIQQTDEEVATTSAVVNVQDSVIQRPEEEATTSAAVNVQDISTQDSSDEFEATDTPPIRFRRRGLLQERLRLQRRTTEIDVTGSSSFDGPSELNQVGILRWWRNRTLLTEETATEMLVCRSMLLQSTLRRVRRDDFNFCRPFKVNFSGEDGDDLGGPKREFLQLLMSELSSSVLQGTTDRYFFNHNIEKLANGVYEMAGKLFAFSLLHGGPGMPVMHPIVYELIVNGEVKSPLPNVEECVIDMETRGKILRLQNVTNQDEYSSVVAEIGDWLLEQSVPVNNFMSFEQKDRLVDILKHNEISYRVQSELTQFTNGMNKVGGFLDALKLAPEVMQSLFVNKEEPLRFRTMRDMYTIDWSPEGSNNHALEKKAVYCLEAFLADCEGGATGVPLESVLSFWTGASKIPPLGFDHKLEVKFGASRQLPCAHTCGLILTIWRGFDNPDDFEESFRKAIQWAGGFHLV